MVRFKRLTAIVWQMCVSVAFVAFHVHKDKDEHLCKVCDVSLQAAESLEKHVTL